MLAPLALIIFAVACFVVLTSGDSGSNSSAGSEQSSTKSDASGSEENSTAGTTPTTTAKTYKVKAGDSFAAIAEELNIDVDTLAELNSEVDPRALQPGQKLKLR